MATQKERSAEASRLLKTAAIDLMFEIGLNRMSTTDIAERAGLSRGALTHHFPNRQAVIVASVAYKLETVCEELDRFGREFRTRRGNTDELIDYIWRLMSGKLFFVTLEYLLEARHNAEFKRQLVPIVRKFHGSLDSIWSDLADHLKIEREVAQLWMSTTMCVIRGLLVQSIMREDAAYFTSVLTLWKQQAAAAFRSLAGGADKGNSTNEREHS